MPKIIKAIPLLIFLLLLITPVYAASSPRPATARPTNTDPNRIRIPRPFRVFDNPSFYATPIANFHPQYVHVIHRQGYWVLISTRYGQLWANVYPHPQGQEIAGFMYQFGDTVALFYENFATGFTFAHQGDRVYFAASTTKAPFALYIFHQAEMGRTHMDDVITFTRGDRWDGTGIIRHRYRVGQTFTQERLLYLMLAPSDNIATRMLRRTHGVQGYRDFVARMGGNPDFVQNITYSYLSANEAGVFLRAFWDYINAGGRYSYMFRDFLLANRTKLITASYPVASKSGWAGNFGGAWHDMAIVYAPSPYGLALLSTRVGGTVADRRVYNEISRFIQDFNNTWFE